MIGLSFVANIEGLTMDQISRLLFVTISPRRKIILLTLDDLHILEVYQDREEQPIAIACDYVNG